MARTKKPVKNKVKKEVKPKKQPSKKTTKVKTVKKAKSVKKTKSLNSVKQPVKQAAKTQTAKLKVKKIKKEFQGRVVSDKMDKTVVVLVSTIKFHPKYYKRYQVHKKYKVHDAKNQFKAGDTVTFTVSKAHSKTKKWEVIY